MYGRRTWCPLPRAPRVRSVLSGKEGLMAHRRHRTAAERERRATAAAALVRSAVEKAGNQGNLAVLSSLDLARTVALARVQWAGTLRADGRAPPPFRPPPAARVRRGR
jgi:hypothetical protein